MAKTAAATAPGSDILRDAVAAALGQSNNDVQTAAEALTKQLLSDAVLLQAFEDHLYRAAYDLVSHFVRGDRRRSLSVVTGGNVGGGLLASAGTGHGRSAASNEGLMFFPIHGGKRIKDATAAEIRASGEFYLKQGATMTGLGRWQVAVAAHLDAGKKLTEDALRKLHAKATQDA